MKSLAGVNSIVPTYQYRLWYRSGPVVRLHRQNHWHRYGQKILPLMTSHHKFVPALPVHTATQIDNTLQVNGNSLNAQ